MIKYIIIFSAISFCVSIPRYVGTHVGLVFVQHSPITSFFGPRVIENVQNSTDAVITYFTEHWMIFDARRWIIHGLWPFGAQSEILTLCKNLILEHPTYSDEDMDEDFTDDLKTKWPVLRVNETEEILWEAEYNKYGSCVTEDVPLYFAEAMELWNTYEAGTILGRSGIVPGVSYEFDRIVASFQKALNAQFYLKCIPSQNNQQEILLEVQICVDAIFELTNCTHRERDPDGIHQCDRNKTIIYPGMPRFEF